MARPKAFRPDEVLALAAARFRMQGYSATSLSDLEQATGLGRQSLYDTFGDKASLFRRVFAAECAAEEGRIGALFNEAAGGVSRLRAFLQARAERLAREGGSVLVWAGLEWPTDHAVRAALAQLHTRELGAVATLLSMAARRGEVRGTPGAAVLARVVVTAGAGLALQAAGSRPGAPIAAGGDPTATVDALMEWLRAR